MPSDNKKSLKRAPLLIATLSFVVGILLASLAAWQQRIENQRELQQQFDAEAKKLVNAVVSHIRTYEYPLLGLRGLVVAYGDDSITRRAFRNYTMSRSLDTEFTGTRGFGFIRRVASENEANFLKQARQDEMPDFSIRQLAPHSGEKYIIQYIEPAGRNRSAIGLDIASEENRRTAAQQAMRSGSTIITAPITLVQTSGLPLRSFLLLLPVYHLNMPLYSAEQREAATFGWMFSPIVIDEVLKQTGIASEQIALQVADFSANAQKNVFYSSPEFADAIKTQHTANINRVVFGRGWQFQLRAQPLFYQYHQRLSPIWVASVVVFCSLLLSVLLYFYLCYRQRTLTDSIEQQRLAAIVESANDAIISLDLNGIITSWNRAADILFDFSAAEAIGQNAAILLAPDELKHQDQEFLRKIQRGELIPRFDTIRKTRDGQSIDVSVTASLIRDHRGRVVGAAKTIVDITQQKRRQDLFRLTVEAIPYAIITVNHDNIITLLNQKAIDLFGYEKAELLGQNISLLLPVRYREQHEVHTQNFHSNPVAKAVGTCGQTLSVLCKDGSEVPVEIQLSPIQTDTQTFTLATIVDISLRKELQSELQTTLARMKMAVEALGAGIWVWQIDGNKLIWDKRMLELYEVPESMRKTQLYYDFWCSRVHPDDIGHVEQKLLAQIAGTDIYNPEFRIVLNNGEIRYIQAAGIVERDNQGNPIQMVGVNRDITELKIAEARIKELNEKRTAELEELNASLEYQVAVRIKEITLAMNAAQQANHAKSEFLANMSHEIRTPMNAILGLAYLIQKQEITPTVREMVKKIDHAGHSLLTIINECLDFSKIEAKLVKIEQAPFCLSEVLDDLATIMSSAVAAKQIEVCIAPLPKQANYLRGDAVRLEQVLINLASNAIKFTEKGEVVVEIQIIEPAPTTDQIRLRFSVRDTGIGILPQKQESIFEPFIQADNSTTRLYGGTGLGLSISRNLVELMGSTLQLKSELGVGSEFFFELVLPVGEKTNSPTPDLSYQKVLIADDNDTARKFLESIVVSLGWNAEVVDSGEKALQIIAEKGANYFDLLLLDWQMPEVNGVQVLTKIQHLLDKKHCPIIIMVTAYDRGALLEQIGSELADRVICKPVTCSVLFNAVLEAKIKRGELSHHDKQDIDDDNLLGINLLVVDDSEINRDVAYQILTRKGAEVEVVENGRDAIIRLTARPDYFHLVLMDVQMPIMDGYTATRQIRATPELKQLPIIALTAGAFKSQQDAALEAGMDDFIAKPFEVDELVASIKRLTHAKAAETVTTLPAVQAISQTQIIKGDDLLLIDIEQGLKKWREVAPYQKALRLFLEQHAQDAAQIHDALATGSKTTAVAITHKLLGAAGVLSLKRVVYFAEQIETVLSKEGDAGDSINRLAFPLSQTIDAIKTYLDSEIKPETWQTNFAEMDLSVIKVLEQLIKTLDSDDPALIEPQLDALSGKIPKQQFDQLLAAVENFDFRGAETIANALRTKISSQE